MKSLLQKIFLFFFILFLIKVPVYLYYKDELRHRKSEFAKQPFDTVFIGSSRTKFAVIPNYFDSLMQKQTKSYNFGVTVGLPPRTLDWCEEIIKSKQSLKYIFVELSGEIYGVVTDEEPWTNFSLSEYLTNLKKLSFHRSSNYHNILVLRFFKPYISQNFTDYNEPNSENNVKKTPSPKALNTSRSRNLEIEKTGSENFLLNNLYWERIVKLIDLADSRRIQIYFFIPPRLESQSEVETIYPIYQRLDKKYKLNVAHYEESLYQNDTSLDNFHLNRKGATQFTEMLAEAFSKNNF